MTKILKKSLACLLVFALCFTAIASCLAVSAAAPAMSVGALDLYVERPSNQNSTNPEVCEGERYRIQLGVGDLEAGSIIGISVLMPKGIELGDIAFQDMNWNGNRGKVEVVSQYLDTETRWLKMVLNVTSNGDNIFFWRFNATANIPKDQVFSIYAVIEAANTSAAGDENIFTHETNSRPMRVMLNHNETEIAGKDATCEEAGLTAGSKCTRCEKVLVEQEEVKALGHDYEGVANPDSTCNSEGTMVYTCKNDASHTYTEAISKKDHTPAADLVDNKDGTHSEVCDVCGAKLSTAEHDFTNGDCACGAKKPAAGPVLDEELEFRDIIVTVTSTVNMRYRIFKNDDATEGKRGYMSLGYDRVEVVLTGTAYSFDAANLYNEEAIPETLVANTGNNSKGHTYLYEGIAMCSLGLKVKAYIKAYKNDEYVAHSPMFETTPEEALRVVLAESTTDGGRASIIELLNMAAAAQTLFGNTKKDSDLGKAVAAGQLVNKNLETSVVTEVPELNVVDYTVAWEAGTEDFQSKLTIEPSMSLTVSPNIRLIVKGKNNLADNTKVSVEFVYNNPVAGNLGKIDTKPLTAAEGGTLSKRYNFDIPGFEFHNSDKTVTAKIYYDGQLIATVQYSVETYVYEQLNSSEASQYAKDLNAAIAKFGFAFRLAKGFATI